MRLAGLLLLGRAGWALMLHGKEVLFHPITPHTRVNALVLVEAREYPPTSLHHFGSNVFLLPKIDPGSVRGGGYVLYSPQHKHRHGLRGGAGLVLTCRNASAEPGVQLGRGRVFLPGPLDIMDMVRLANSPNIVFMHEPAGGITGHSVRGQFMSNPAAAPFGSGARLLISDDVLDPTHCSFYQGGSPPVFSLPLTGAVPVLPPTTSKVMGILVFEYSAGLFTNSTAYPDSHGTKVAGTSSGLACQTQEGVAPQDQFLFMTMAVAPFELALPPDWQRVFAVASVHAHSISWGLNDSAGQYDPLAAELDEVAFNNDTLHCVSAGNTGGLLSSPATMKNALSVGACTSEACTAVANFSSTGPSNDGRTRLPRVMAVGINVNSSQSLVGQAPGYAAFTVVNGTSAASAAICGLVGLFVDFYGSRPPAALILAALVNSARAVPGSASFGQPDVDLWAGMLYFAGALASNTDARYCLVANASSVSVTLAWMDPPGVPYASPVLVNNLALTVLHGGNQYTPANVVDNVVQVQLTNATVGLPVEVYVRAQGVVVLPPQRFGLVAAGVANSTCDVVVPCNVSHGSGILIPTGCLILVCDPNYQLIGSECVCKPSISCGGTVVVLCENNTFVPCPQSIIIIETVTVEPGALSWTMIAFTAFLLLACCGFSSASVHMQRKPKEHKSPPPSPRYVNGADKHV